MTKDEALDLALEELYPIAHNSTDDPRGQAYKAITAIKQARALDVMAENARELGLDYEPVQEPSCQDTGHCVMTGLACFGPSAAPVQEPVAYINVEQRKLEWAKYMSWDTPTVVNLPKIPLYTTPPAAPVQETPFHIGQRLRQEGKGISDLWGAVGSDVDMLEAQRGFDHAAQPAPVREPVAKHYMDGGHLVYPAAQRQWVGLTDEEKQEWVEAMPDEPKPRHIMNLINVIEAKLKEKNT
jgi:hypothetical protein